MNTFFFCKPIAHKCYISCLVYSISSKHVFIAVSNFSDRKKKWNQTLPVQFSPPHPGKSQIPTPGKALQIKFPTPRAQNIVKCPGFARGGGDVEVSIWSAHDSGVKNRQNISPVFLSSEITNFGPGCLLNGGRSSTPICSSYYKEPPFS